MSWKLNKNCCVFLQIITLLYADSFLAKVCPNVVVNLKHIRISYNCCYIVYFIFIRTTLSNALLRIITENCKGKIFQ